MTATENRTGRTQWRIAHNTDENCEPTGEFDIVTDDTLYTVASYMTEADAELTIRAVSCHDDLLAACELAARVLQDHDIDESMSGEFEIITDAIAKARGDA